MSWILQLANAIITHRHACSTSISIANQEGALVVSVWVVDTTLKVSTVKNVSPVTLDAPNIPYSLLTLVKVEITTLGVVNDCCSDCSGVVFPYLVSMLCTNSTLSITFLFQLVNATSTQILVPSPNTYSFFQRRSVVECARIVDITQPEKNVINVWRDIIEIGQSPSATPESVLVSYNQTLFCSIDQHLYFLIFQMWRHLTLYRSDH